jgi:hypothetical protein
VPLLDRNRDRDERADIQEHLCDQLSPRIAFLEQATNESMHRPPHAYRERQEREQLHEDERSRVRTEWYDDHLRGLCGDRA